MEVKRVKEKEEEETKEKERAKEEAEKKGCIYIYMYIYSETCIQGTPQYSREVSLLNKCPFMADSLAWE